jgi:hypothetical protein
MTGNGEGEIEAKGLADGLGLVVANELGEGDGSKIVEYVN